MVTDSTQHDGTPDKDVIQRGEDVWQDTAKQAGVDLSGFDPAAPLHKRIAWALQAGLIIAVLYTRFSTRMQTSTWEQTRACIEFAARHKMYVPPEFLCADEAVTGRQKERTGLNRARSLLSDTSANVLLVYNVSRLFRRAYDGHLLFQEELVENGMRGISVSNNIDTNVKGWKVQMVVLGLMGEEALESLADGVRESHRTLFEKGFCTGALPVGFYPEEVPDAPRTRRNLPRTKPAVDERVKPHIQSAFRRVAEGMPITEALRRYRQECGAVDPRGTNTVMGYESFKRLLQRMAYLGVWEFGRKRNRWSSKRDAVEQVEQPEAEIKLGHWPHLQIVDEDVFYRVQARLENQKSGPHGPRSSRLVAMWDLLTETFVCAACGHRFYVAGSRRGQAMQCPNPQCANRGTVGRRDAVLAICQKLQQLIVRDTDLVAQTITAAQADDGQAQQQLHDDLAAIDKRIQRVNAQIDALYEMTGDGNEQDRREVQAKIKAKRAERNAIEQERVQLKQALARLDERITPEQVRGQLEHFTELLCSAGTGQLGDEAVYEAAEIVRQLVGGCIKVAFEPRSGRKSTVVHGIFQPSLIETVSTGAISTSSETSPGSVHVWLRRPPREDQLAPLVAYLYDVAGAMQQVTYPGITGMLNRAGLKIGCGNVYQARQRWYEVIGQAPPDSRAPSGG